MAQRSLNCIFCCTGSAHQADTYEYDGDEEIATDIEVLAITTEGRMLFTVASVQVADDECWMGGQIQLGGKVAEVFGLPWALAQWSAREHLQSSC